VAVTTSNLVLRAGPNTKARRITTIVAGDTLQLLAAQRLNGYVRVASREGDTGWVAFRRIRLLSTNNESSSNQARVSDNITVSASDGDIAGWEKPDPVEQTGGACGAEGLGKNGNPAPDPQTDLRKNRVDTSSAYHSVSFDQILALPWTGLPRKRTGWNQTDSVQVAKYEGPPIELEGYLVDVVEEGIESTNCEIDTHAWHDWHMWMVPTPTEAATRARTRAIVVEVTPRVRGRTPNWVLASVRAVARNHEKVRIAGWLMWDPDHPDQVGKTRGTTWEIHPVTRIEVFRNGAWTDIGNP
jgi:uncharacterized protein YgiM (DUF1202 family)